MLFSVPLFSPATYIVEPNSYDFGLSLVYTLGPETAAGQRVFNDTVRIQSALSQNPLVRLYINTDINYIPPVGKNASSQPKPTILEWADEEVDLAELRSTEQDVAQLDGLPDN